MSWNFSSCSSSAAATSLSNSSMWS
jgi:hypothetical protein